MDPTFGYDELFAYRVMLQDDYENESDIIRELKYILLERGMPLADIPDFLRIFYETYGINISLNTINETLNAEQNAQFQNENDFLNLLTGMLNNQIININTQMANQNVNQNANQNVNQNDLSNNQQVNLNDSSNNHQVDVVVNVEDDDDDNDLLEEANNDDNDLEDANNDEDDLDTNNQNDDLPPLEPMTIGNLSSMILTLTANGVQTSLPPIPINPGHTPQQIENILHTLINQQGVSSLSSMFNQQLPHPSIFDNMFNPLIAPMQDVVPSLDDEALKNLKKYKSDKVLDENCSICMSKMGDNQEEELCKLPCEHDFHVSCIEPYLKEYNYKCPICRKEVGKPKFDI
jgi:hypothetical protein